MIAVEPSSGKEVMLCERGCNTSPYTLCFLQPDFEWTLHTFSPTFMIMNEEVKKVNYRKKQFIYLKSFNQR